MRQPEQTLLMKWCINSTAADSASRKIWVGKSRFRVLSDGSRRDLAVSSSRKAMNNSTCCPSTDSPRCGIDFWAGRVIVVTVYSSVFLLGLTTNLLTLWPIIQQVRQQKNVLGIYLLTLVTSDLLYILTLPLWVLYVFGGSVWTLGNEACALVAFVFYSNMYISVCLLCCISLDRYLAVVYPIRSLAFRSQRAAGATCFVVTIIVFAFHLGVTIGSDEHDGVSCYDTYPLQRSVAKFNYFRFVAGFLLPLAVLATSYLKIFQGVKQSSSLSQEKKAKVKHLSIGVIVIFLLCFAPYHLLLLLRTVVFTSYADPDASCVFERKVHVYFSVALAMSSLNSALDPILYILVSDSVKEDLKRAFRCQANLCQSGQAPTMTPGIKRTLEEKIQTPDNIATKL